MIPGNHLEENNSISTEPAGEIKSFSTPRLTPEEKLYVRVYLSTLSHSKAYESVKPGLASYYSYSSDNQFSRRDNVKFHISLGLQEKAEALSLTPDLVLERLWKEALREGAGSNHSARIQALTQLGKHLGLFEEKKENNSHTFNIINYSSTSEPVLLESLKEEVLEESVDQVDLENITITNYSTSDQE